MKGFKSRRMQWWEGEGYKATKVGWSKGKRVGQQKGWRAKVGQQKGWRVAECKGKMVKGKEGTRAGG